MPWDLPQPGELLLPECARCGYPLREVAAGADARCPECGQPAERIPESGVFVCQPRTWSRKHRGRWRSGMINAVLLGAGVSAMGLMTGQVSPLIAAALGAGTLALAAPIAWCLCKPRSSARRIRVDLNTRRFIFERCWLQRHWGWPRSTGGGYECGFDELLGSELLGQTLLITTPRGRIGVNYDWTCFPALARTVHNAAPNPPPGPLAQGHDRNLAFLIILLMALGTAIFLFGAIHNWW